MGMHHKLFDYSEIYRHLDSSQAETVVNILLVTVYLHLFGVYA